MVREVRGADAEFLLNLAGNHAFRVCGEEELCDAKARFGANRSKHIGESGDFFRRRLFHDEFDISMIIEMALGVKGGLAAICCDEFTARETSWLPRYRRMTVMSRRDGQISFDAIVERIAPEAPRFVVYPGKAWNETGTCLVDVSLNGVSIGLRSLIPWKERGWHFGLSQPMCRKVGVDTGSHVSVEMRTPDKSGPDELKELLNSKSQRKEIMGRTIYRRATRVCIVRRLCQERGDSHTPGEAPPWPLNPPSALRLGFALYQAHIGQRHESAKMLHVFTDTVWQVRADDPSGTYHTVYAAQLGETLGVSRQAQRRMIVWSPSFARVADLPHHRSASSGCSN
jgi:hypothetical protein